MIDVAFAAFGGAWLAIFMLVFIVVGVPASNEDLAPITGHLKLL